MVPKEKVVSSQDKLGLIQRLWIHESTRVFSDRLIDETDKDLFTETIQEVVDSVQPNYIDFSKIKIDQIIFANFVNYNPSDPQYEESAGAL
jgi:hypothetical protein